MTTLSGHRRIYLDANVFIYTVEGVEPYSTTLRPVLGAMAMRLVEAVTSELTLTAVLVKPLRSNDTTTQNAFVNFLYRSIGLTTVAVDRDVLMEAARLRATMSLRLPDAIHVASARLHGCSSFVTNDARLNALPGLTTQLVSELPTA